MPGVDEVLSAKPFGPFQRSHFILCSWAWVPIAIQLFSMVFITPSEVQWSSLSTNTTDNNSCSIPAALRHFHEPARTVTAEFGLVCERAHLVPVPGVSLFAGLLFGSSCFGTLADRLGRRTMFRAAVLSALFASMVSALASSFALFVVLRFAAGFAVGGLMTVNFVYMSEFIGPTWRGFTGSFTMVFFAIGEVLLALIAYALPSWRLLLVIGCFPYAVYFVTWHRMLESPRWLALHGRAAEATRAMEAVCKINNVPAEPIDIASAPPASPLSALFAPQIRRWTVVLLLQFVACDLLYYGISLAGSALASNTYVNFTLAGLVEIPSFVLAYWAIERPQLGRRLSLLASFLVTGATCLLVPVLWHAPRSLLLSAALVGKLGASAAFTIIYIYAVEVFPTVVRSAGVGLCATASRVGSLAVPFLGSRANSTAGFTLFASVALAMGAITLLLPETRGVALSDTLAPTTYTREETNSVDLPEDGEAHSALLTSSSTRESML
eukprot:m.243494 g.243494  ORF g.243494 m.243494 type:complete len:496 (+) comp27852_c0_seq1:62-1549(+)